MMTYQETILFEEAVKKFINIYISRKSEFEIHYYEFENGSRKYDCSFIGYETNTGLHGIHYNRTTNTHLFGTRNDKLKSELHGMMYPQIELIPIFLKDALLEVANNKPKFPKLIRVVKKRQMGI